MTQVRPDRSLRSDPKSVFDVTPVVFGMQAVLLALQIIRKTLNPIGRKMLMAANN